MAYARPLALLTPITPSMPICTPISEQFDSLPITPPEIPEILEDDSVKADGNLIQKALHVLATEREALSHLEQFYSTSASAQEALLAAISQIVRTQSHRGKLVFTGIGKSRHIALKLVATFLSLGVHAEFLHPTDALHGDLGLLRPTDTVLMITFSGRTPELLTLLPHINPSIPLILMSSHHSPETCPLLTHRSRSASPNILLPTPIHISETTSFGIAAPTTSTTVTLALGDSLALAVAEKLHMLSGLHTPDVFAANHPGGAIGTALARPNITIPKISQIATMVVDVPSACGSQDQQSLRCLDVLLMAARSPSGFVRISPHHIIGPRRIQNFTSPEQMVHCHQDVHGPVVTEKTDWISVLGDTSIEECRDWIQRMRVEGDGRGKHFLRRGTLLGIVDEHNEVSGIVEIEDLMGDNYEW